MRVGIQISSSTSHLPTDGLWSLVSALIMAELARGADGTEIVNQISAQAGFELRTSRLTVKHANHYTTGIY